MLIGPHQTERLTRDPIGESCAPVFKDRASVVKNSLSLSVTLAAVAAEEPVAGFVAGAVVAAVVGGCKKFSTLVNAAKSRVSERFGNVDTGCVLGAVVLVVLAGTVAV
jgi:cysteine synthase